MITVDDPVFSLVGGLIALIVQLAMLIIVFSLPGRFREQREYLEQQKREIEKKLDILQETQNTLLKLYNGQPPNQTTQTSVQKE